MTAPRILWPAFLLWFAAAALSHIVLFAVRMPVVYDILERERLDILFALTRFVTLAESACGVFLAIALIAASRIPAARPAVRIIAAVVLMLFAVSAFTELLVPLIGGAGLAGPAWVIHLAVRLLLGVSAAAAAIAVFAAPRAAWLLALVPPVLHLAAYGAYEVALSALNGSVAPLDRLFGLGVVVSVLVLFAAVAIALKRAAAPQS